MIPLATRCGPGKDVDFQIHRSWLVGHGFVFDGYMWWAKVPTELVETYKKKIQSWDYWHLL